MTTRPVQFFVVRSLFRLNPSPSSTIQYVVTVCRIGICRRELNIRLDLVFLQKEVNVCSFCIENKFSPVMSFNGDVVFEENLEYKERAFQILPMLKKMYQEPTNPLFKVFHINIKKIRTFSSAEGPKEYSLE